MTFQKYGFYYFLFNNIVEVVTHCVRQSKTMALKKMLRTFQGSLLIAFGYIKQT